MTREKMGEKIIELARYYEGLHETKQNSEWDNLSTPGFDPAAKALKDALRLCGWQDGWPYCAAFCEAIWKQAYTSMGAPVELLVKITTRCSPSVMRTFKAWNSEINLVPQPGAIFFMQFSRTDRGHAGIVIHANDTQFATIEANTSPMPSSSQADREGDGIFRKVRQLSFQERQGLWLRGFLNPIPWA